MLSHPWLKQGLFLTYGDKWDWEIVFTMRCFTVFTFRTFSFSVLQYSVTVRRLYKVQMGQGYCVHNRRCSYFEGVHTEKFLPLELSP